MNTAELIVELVVPDTTAITAYHTLKKIEFDALKKLKRSDYYKFDIEESADTFAKKISKVDVLVNANKHRCSFIKEKRVTGETIEETDDGFKVNVLVQSAENDAGGLLSTLKNRLGFKQIKNMEKGTLWTMFILAADKEEAIKVSENITKSLLYNEHYQKYKVI